MLSKLAIGTVKFGMAYGVGRDARQVDSEETLSLINHCSLQGVDMFDTAPAYGIAESILGDQNCSDWARIITKVEKVAGGTIDQRAVDLLDKKFKHSLTRLGAKKVYGLLIHSVDDLGKPGAENIMAWMQSLKDKGLVERIGASVYDPVEVTRYYQEHDFDLIQLPLNLFDQRFLANNLLQQLSARGVEIHARSLFLKGLLLNSIVPSGLDHELGDHHQNYTHTLKRANMDPFDVCMAFAEKVIHVDKWVLGFSRLQQLKRVLQWQNSTADQFEETAAGLTWMGKEWMLNSVNVDPRNWPSR